MCLEGDAKTHSTALGIIETLRVSQTQLYNFRPEVATNYRGSLH